MSTYTTIWMVTSGWYSDITWAAAFTTKELAEQSINEGGLGDDIHELKLFDILAAVNCVVFSASLKPTFVRRDRLLAWLVGFLLQQGFCFAG